MFKKMLKYIGELCIKIYEWVTTNSILIYNTVFCIILAVVLLPFNVSDFMLIIVSYLLIGFGKYIDRRHKEEINKPPMINKRFTRKMEDGSISIKKYEWQEAIMYLYMLENYFGK